MVNDTNKTKSRLALAITLAIAAGLFLLLYLTGDQVYFILHPARFLPIHIVAELFSIIVSFSVFAVGFYTPSKEADVRVRVLSAVFLAVGMLDLFHMLTYERMPLVLFRPSANRAALFWIAARAMAALGLLAVPLLPEGVRPRLPRWLIYPASLAATAAVTWLIAAREPWLPKLFVAGQGLTPVRIGAEFAIVAVMALTGLLLYRQLRTSPNRAKVSFIKAVIFLVFGELAFALYLNVSDVYNLLGHAYKVLGYFYILQAAYVVNVRRPYEDLQRLVAERTAELERALAALEEVDRHKDEFISGLSHDLKTPLVPAVGFLEMLLGGRAGPLGDKQREYLRHCRGAVQRQVDLINELLDYARLRSGRVRLEPERLDLREVVRAAAATLESMAMQRGQRVEVRLGEEPLMVEADRTKLLRVLNNLFSNAVKFNSEHGLVRVEAGCRNGQAVVSVQDTGQGIAAADREHVFERFYQAGAGRRSGSGIGLWVVAEIMRLHGGRVELESEPGRGSRFSILLACSRSAGPDEDAPTTGH